MLETDAMQVASPVLRGAGAGNGLRLFGEGRTVRPILYSTFVSESPFFPAGIENANDVRIYLGWI